MEWRKLSRAAPMSRGDASMQWSGRMSFWWHMQAGYAMQREFAKEPMQRCFFLFLHFPQRTSPPRELRGSYRRSSSPVSLRVFMGNAGSFIFRIARGEC